MKEHLIHKTDLMKLLFQRISREPEPPLKILTLQLLCNLTRLISIIELDVNIQNIVINGWLMMNTIATSEHISDDSKIKNYTEKDVYVIEIESGSTLVCTEPASLALEIMGWIIAGTLHRAPNNPETGGLSETAGEVVAVAGINMATEWIHLLEQGADEEKGPVTREASARSITSSNILSWVTIQARNGDQTMNHSGEWAVLAVRVWLTALKLMQDDDEDIRDIIAISITEIENKFEKNNEMIENINMTSSDSLKDFMPNSFYLVQVHTYKFTYITIYSYFLVFR
jgi:hypothetical protein